jgi:hypothetical protein
MKKLSIIIVLCIICFGCRYNLLDIIPGNSEGGITAAYKMGEVDVLAKSYKQELKLISVISENVNPDGTSTKWIYRYVATTPSELGKTYYFHATYYEVAFDSISGPIFGPAVITQTWFNSDKALSIAERNGGSQFRKQNLHYTIEADMGEPGIPNSTTYWWITYREAGNRNNYLMLSIDANTGIVTAKYP